MLDAFRPDYLAGTPFLAALARGGWSGRYQESFGFTPRDAYFRGAAPAESGYTHMFGLDPAFSPFAPARHFPPESRLSPATRFRLRQDLLRHAASQVGQFVAAYVHPFEIPFHLLPEFNLAEQTAPWQPAAGRRSVFEELTALGREWLYAAWPAYRELGLRSDEDVAEFAMERIGTGTAFAFVQFPDLDSAGHEFGPGSSRILAAVQRQDRLVRRLLERLEEKDIRPDVLIYGDHGMVNVVRGLDVVSLLEQTGLEAPADFVYFLDSTSARFWYRHPEARARIRAALAPLSGGRWLQPEDWRRYGLEGIDRANGEDLFLADPGVMLAPNFFHHDSHLPRGMHGYAPEATDNQGLFVLSGGRLGAPRQVGTVLPEVFHAVLRSLLFGDGDLSVLLPDRSQPQAAGAAVREATVTADIATALERIRPLLRPEDAVVLHGGFGRGEGTMTLDNGRYRALNDYDLMVLGPAPEPDLDWKAIGRELADAVKLPYFDFGWLDRAMLDDPPRSLFFYDFLNGSQVLLGDPSLLASASRFAVSEIPPEEGLRLVLNRVVGVLIGLSVEALPPAVLPPQACEFLSIQCSKLAMALADRRLLEWQAYDVSYAVRLRRFGELARAAGLPASWIDLLAGGYEWKLRLHTPPFEDPRPVLPALFDIARSELAAALHAGEGGDLSGAVWHFIESQPPGLHGDKMRCRASAVLLLEVLDGNLQPIAGRLAEAAPLLAAASPRYESLWVRLPDSETGLNDPLMYYEQLRRSVVEAWEDLCH